VTLGTGPAQCNIYMSLECSLPNICTFGRLVKNKIFKKWTLSGSGTICDHRHFIWTYLNLFVPRMITGCCIWNSIILDYWFMRRRALNVFPYISIRKIKRPVVGPIVGRFYFYVQTSQTMPQGCCMSNIWVFGMPVHGRFLKFTKYYTFLSLIGPK